MNTSSFLSATQSPACPITKPSSIVVRIGSLDDVAAEVDDDFAEVDDDAAEADDGGKTMTNARLPLYVDVTMLSR